MEQKQRRADPSDVPDDEWAFIARCLTLMTEGAPQRVYDLREVFNGFALHGKSRCSLAHDAQRPAYLACGLPADPSLAWGRCLSGDGRRPSSDTAYGLNAKQNRTQRRTDRCNP